MVAAQVTALGRRVEPMPLSLEEKRAFGKNELNERNASATSQVDLALGKNASRVQSIAAATGEGERILREPRPQTDHRFCHVILEDCSLELEMRFIRDEAARIILNIVL
jgi:hypothetical protein